MEFLKAETKIWSFYLLKNLPPNRSNIFTSVEILRQINFKQLAFHHVSDVSKDRFEIPPKNQKI